MRSGKSAGCAMNGQCQPPMAPSLSIAAHMSSVGTMSMIAALQHLVRMVEAHAVRGAPAAVVAGDEEAVVAERLHHLDLVLRHGAERVVDAAGLLGRGGAVAIAAQVGGHDVEVLRQPRRDRMPGDVRERVAMQQQQRRAAAAMAQADARAARCRCR